MKKVKKLTGEALREACWSNAEWVALRDDTFKAVRWAGLAIVNGNLLMEYVWGKLPEGVNPKVPSTNRLRTEDGKAASQKFQALKKLTDEIEAGYHSGVRGEQQSIC